MCFCESFLHYPNWQRLKGTLRPDTAAKPKLSKAKSTVPAQGTHSHSHTHTHTNTHTQKHTHTHRHTHTCPRSVPDRLIWNSKQALNPGQMRLYHTCVYYIPGERLTEMPFILFFFPFVKISNQIRIAD